MYRVALAFVVHCAVLSFSFGIVSPAKAVEAYIFRGAGDFSFIAKPLTFSEGLDTLGDKLNASGIHAEVYRWQALEWAWRDIMNRKPDAVAIMGHSMGALTAITLANRLKGTGIRVAYMGLIDIPGPVGATPSNVELAENFYHAFPVYGLLPVTAGHKGIIRNEYVWGNIHITMDNSRRVHDSMISAIWLADSQRQRTTLQAYSSEENSQTLAKVDQVLARKPAPEPRQPDALTTATVAPRPAGKLPPIE
ncbi:MAG: thioesterase domain-containing protein [Nitratireductor sp.]